MSTPAPLKYATKLLSLLSKCLAWRERGGVGKQTVLLSKSETDLILRIFLSKCLSSHPASIQPISSHPQSSFQVGCVFWSCRNSASGNAYGKSFRSVSPVLFPTREAFFFLDGKKDPRCRWTLIRCNHVPREPTGQLELWRTDPWEKDQIFHMENALGLNILAAKKELCGNRSDLDQIAGSPLFQCFFKADSKRRSGMIPEEGFSSIRTAFLWLKQLMGLQELVLRVFIPNFVESLPPQNDKSSQSSNSSSYLFGCEAEPVLHLEVVSADRSCWNQ